MADLLQKTTSLCELATTAFRNNNLSECGNFLQQLKVLLTKLSFIPNSSTNVSTKELFIAREVLELGTQYSIKIGDIPAFERYMAQLKVYYFDYRSSLCDTAYMYQLLGLNLLCLLSQNRIADFHTELERLDSKLLESNLYIRYSVKLEQHLMEGAYNRVFLLRENVPAESYGFFTDILMVTLREEIGACCEKAYVSLPIPDAQRILFLKTPAELHDYIQTHNWTIEGDKVFFPKAEKVSNSVDPNKLISQTLEYALELEKIV